MRDYTKHRIFYKDTHHIIYDRHSNYKTYLAEKKKEAELRIEATAMFVKAKRKKIKELESELEDMKYANKLYKEDSKDVDIERSFRRKINALLKKHDFLYVDWQGDEDVYTTWVYSHHFNLDQEGDPFHDEHYHDSYEEAYEACIEYINYHNNKKEVA